MTKLNTYTLTTALILGLATPAFAGDFAALDSNADGQITFDEFRAHATANGATTTLAAQDFTRMAQGDAIITEDEFFLADAMKDDPFALRAMGTSVTIETPVQTFDNAPVEYVAPAPVSSETNTVEMVEPPVLEEAEETVVPVTTDDLTDAPKPTEIIKPLEEVAGEVETPDEVMEPVPMEEGVTNSMDDEMWNSDTETDTSETEDETSDLEPEDGGMN